MANNGYFALCWIESTISLTFAQDIFKFTGRPQAAQGDPRRTLQAAHDQLRQSRLYCIVSPRPSSLVSNFGPQKVSRSLKMPLPQASPNLSRGVTPLWAGLCGAVELSEVQILRPALPVRPWRHAMTVLLLCGRPASLAAISARFSSSSLPPSFAPGRRTAAFTAPGTAPSGVRFSCSRTAPSGARFSCSRTVPSGARFCLGGAAA